MCAKSFFSITILLSFLFTFSTAWANVCSKADIDFYLQRGFSHEQVVRLCSNAPVMGQKTPAKTSPAPAQTKPVVTPAISTTDTTTPTTDTTQPAGNMVSQSDLIYFKTAIESDQVELTPDSLSYTRSGCIKYGEEDITGFKEDACVTTRTKIERSGLKVLKAQSGIFLIRDAELIVAGKITREVLDADKLKTKKRKTFLAEYSLNPAQINIPLRSGIKPNEVAARLQALAK